MYYWGSSSLLADTLQREHIMGNQFKMAAYCTWQPPAAPHLQGWSQTRPQPEERQSLSWSPVTSFPQHFFLFLLPPPQVYPQSYFSRGLYSASCYLLLTGGLTRKWIKIVTPGAVYSSSSWKVISLYRTSDKMQMLRSGTKVMGLMGNLFISLEIKWTIIQ